MALFNEDNLVKKLGDLNMSQQSIQTLSLWLIHHKKHSTTVVNVWFKELCKATDTRKLTFMYLANDVIQNGKKKGPEYNKEFGKVLTKVFSHLGTVKLDDKSKNGLQRLLSVWEERGVFNHSAIHSFKRGYEGLKSISSKRTELVDIEEEIPDRKRRKTSISQMVSLDSDSEEEDTTDQTTEDATNNNSEENTKDISFSAVVPRDPPPEPEKIIEALQNLETAASADADIRQKISQLPKEISDPSAVTKLTDLKEAEKLFKLVSESLTLLLNYNGRLAEEMEARKIVSKMLHEFVLYQKDKLAQTEATFEEYKKKLTKVIKIKAELKAHLQNLPDISRLPNMSSTLAPLPSAGDLFH